MSCLLAKQTWQLAPCLSLNFSQGFLQSSQSHVCVKQPRSFLAQLQNKEKELKHVVVLILLIVARFVE